MKLNIYILIYVHEFVEKITQSLTFPNENKHVQVPESIIIQCKDALHAQFYVQNWAISNNNLMRAFSHPFTWHVSMLCEEIRSQNSFQVRGCGVFYLVSKKYVQENSVLFYQKQN